MGKRKQPKFKAGDTVVVTIYGTVGKVTNIKLLEGEYVYEVNESEGLFKEDCLRLLDEYDGYLLEQEQIDIEYKFLFGDLVRVKGYDNDLFKVVGFRTEIWRYKEDAWEDVIYELTRINDGEWLEADEDELTLIADYDQAETFIKKYGIVTPVKQEKALLPSPRYQDDSIVDRLLDHYNDYKALYYLFNDKKYKRKMNSIVDQLKNHLNSNSDVT
ncbi:hypothetical protein FZC79_06770 [Rossellomorea vietnamensis]|uniref:YodN n=2 Tax=Rossellomorea TaxID=2837508 RepID=A0A5D4KH07_9BACI|nr:MULTISPECIES: hypothetical protein [Rossellomorea]TYR76574.1 hypothetical protein FZC79_06770 [Rossellomorea vietnamensis]TYS79398.1 hypothetical protein FZC80_10825 [Rossellomorea aquimaris]